MTKEMNSKKKKPKVPRPLFIIYSFIIGSFGVKQPHILSSKSNMTLCPKNKVIKTITFKVQ